MNESDDFKEKPKRRTRQMPLDFVIPLQLEECIYRIQHLPPSPSLELTAGHTTYPAWYGNNLDTGKFKAIFLTGGKITARAVGNLHRWAGTSTRFEGIVEYGPAVYGPVDTLSFLLKCALIFYSFSCGLALFLSILDSLNIVISPVAASLMCLIIILAIALLYNTRRRTQSEQLATQIKAALMQKPGSHD